MALVQLLGFQDSPFSLGGLRYEQFVASMGVTGCSVVIRGFSVAVVVVVGCSAVVVAFPVAVVVGCSRVVGGF